MKRNEIEAYEYYKGLYAPFIILFRADDGYVALKDDAVKVSEALGLPVENETVILSADNILDVVSKLSEYGLQAKIITSRGQSGKYEIPDVAQELDE